MQGTRLHPGTMKHYDNLVKTNIRRKKGDTTSVEK